MKNFLRIYVTEHQNSVQHSHKLKATFVKSLDAGGKDYSRERVLKTLCSFRKLCPTNQGNASFSIHNPSSSGIVRNAADVNLVVSP